jgi:hypothetical protein
MLLLLPWSRHAPSAAFEDASSVPSVVAVGKSDKVGGARCPFCEAVCAPLSAAHRSLYEMRRKLPGARGGGVADCSSCGGEKSRDGRTGLACFSGDQSRVPLPRTPRRGVTRVREELDGHRSLLFLWGDAHNAIDELCFCTLTRSAIGNSADKCVFFTQSSNRKTFRDLPIQAGLSFTTIASREVGAVRESTPGHELAPLLWRGEPRARNFRKACVDKLKFRARREARTYRPLARPPPDWLRY